MNGKLSGRQNPRSVESLNGDIVIRINSCQLAVSFCIFFHFAFLNVLLADTSGIAQFQNPGVKDSLPVFHEAAAVRLTFPLSWGSGQYTNFDEWRQQARAKVKQSLLGSAPIAPFNPIVVAEE